MPNLIETLEAISDLVIDDENALSVDMVIQWRGHDIRITVQLDNND